MGDAPPRLALTRPAHPYRIAGGMMMMSTTPETPPVVTMKKDEFLDIVSQKSGITKADSTKGAVTTYAVCFLCARVCGWMWV